MQKRQVERLIAARPTSDGAGVDITRVVPEQGMQELDPFLMLDEIRGDGGAGFPPHPHRGFETITYMRRGAFQHEDHMGNKGRVATGGAQWMTAGRGVVHSEMPEPEDGWLHGFQIWLNLPAAEKMKAPAYVDMQAADNPLIELQGGGSLRVVAGGFQQQYGMHEARATDPYYYDLTLPAQAAIELPFPASHRVFCYVYEGALQIGQQTVTSQQLAVLGSGEAVEIGCQEASSALILAGRPIKEPVAQYGPFVMNSRSEIERAIDDYRNGRLTA